MDNNLITLDELINQVGFGVKQKGFEMEIEMKLGESSKKLGCT